MKVAAHDKKKILVYADSRGQHTPRGAPVHDVYGVRLAERDDIDVELLLCPMKWTTTLDFLEYISQVNVNDYDHIVLHTGIVEWSPRPQSSAINDLYNNSELKNLNNSFLNIRDYSQKVINNKKDIFDDVFTEQTVMDHLNAKFAVEFEGQPTVNMYSLEMAAQSLIPRIQKLDKVVFVNSNRFVPGWEGDFVRGRPANISLTEEYSVLFRDMLGKEKVVDLLQWGVKEIKHYTCDNMHLTKAGSDYIYEELCCRMGLGSKKPRAIKSSSVGLGAKIDQKSNSILIIGNGPSTKALAEFGFHNIPSWLDTFGMGAAYRYFYQADWWPNYYAWCDAKVVLSHQKSLETLTNDAAISTEKFYFSLPISKSDRFEQAPHGSTGDYCFRKAIDLGYKKIFLIGIEGSYVEEIAESRRLTDGEYVDLGYDSIFPMFHNIAKTKEEAFRIFRDNLLVIENTPDKNPNYFFDDYQQKGDVYSLPRAHTHRNSWRKSAEFAQGSGAEVFNLSENSEIVDFPKMEIKQFLLRAEANTEISTSFAPYGRPMEAAKRLSELDKQQLKQQAGIKSNEKLATLIIGIRFPDNDNSRIINLEFLLDWIDLHYGDLFDVLLIEQDVSSKLDMLTMPLRSYVRHEFIYNPKAFNRGWGYNVAVKYFTVLPVVALMDTDVLTGRNFVEEIVKCHKKYKAISPYTNVYFTNEAEAARVLEMHDFDGLENIAHIAKPTTIAGGIIIVRKETYMEVAGFEQYIEFSGEDRSLDVTLLNHCHSSELRIAPYAYVHLYHPKGSDPRPRWRELYQHLHKNYGCKVDPNLKPHEGIHNNCVHVSSEQTAINTSKRLSAFADLDLYRKGRELTINGVYAPQTKEAREIIFPPAFKGLDDYQDREVYNAPDADHKELGKLYNKYKGKRCFIIGNGPSLNKHNLTLLKDEYTFAVNSFFYKTNETGFRPTFFVVEDTSVMKENIEEIRKYEAPYKFFPTLYKDIHPEKKGVYFFHMNRGFYEKSSPNYCIPRFSTDASRVLYCGQSVTYINLQLAFFLGFAEVYLIGMDFSYIIPDTHRRKGDMIYSTTDDPNHFHKDYFGAGKTWKDPKLERVALNYRQAKLSYEAVGRKIYNATIGGQLEIFERVDYDVLLAGSAAKHKINSEKCDSRPSVQGYLEDVSGLPRSEKASVIETKIISTMMSDRHGDKCTMIDVGAHVGLTASYFEEMGWTIYCFEPDPKNRAKLIERFGNTKNVIIDIRAVSDTVAAGVSFYTSDQSTGISGLSAFHDSHKQTGSVEVTTISDIVEQHSVNKIDFLKIDVEGFDFSVLKGVPWDSIKPDVIECEYEDAKTIPLGHNWRDIAEFLRGKGYAVYISEWHPIVRYGIAHDWRRVAAYPGVEIPSNSWGNILAFQNDPGEEAVQSAFAAHVKIRKKTEKPLPKKSPTIKKHEPSPTPNPPAPKPNPPAYAAFGEKLRARSPRIFALVKFIRRVLAGLWRRKIWTIPPLALFGGLIVLGFLPPFADMRLFVWGCAAFAGVMFLLFYLAFRIFHIATALSSETAFLRLNAKKMEKNLEGLELKISRDFADIRRRQNRSAHELTASEDRLRSEIENAKSGVATSNNGLKGKLF